MLGPEQINLTGLPRLPAVEGVNIRVHETVARQLGLRDGQVVQASVEVRGETLRLTVGGHTLELPNAAKFRQGDAPFFKVLPAPGGKLLQQIRPPGAKAAGGLAAEAAGGAERAASGAHSRGAAPVAVQSAELPARLLALLARPADPAALARLLGAEAVAGALADARSPELSEQWAQLRPSLAGLTPDALRQAVLRSGLWPESQLARGIAPAVDLKLWLRQLWRAMPAESAHRGAIGDAIDSIESLQLEALRGQAQREAGFSLVLPFADAGPVALRIERRAPTGNGDGDEPTWIANVHARQGEAGEFWLRIEIGDGGDVGVALWAPDAGLCDAAKQARAPLQRGLAEAGLSLGRLDVFNAARPAPQGARPARGSVFDLDV